MKTKSKQDYCKIRCLFKGKNGCRRARYYQILIALNSGPCSFIWARHFFPKVVSLSIQLSWLMGMVEKGVSWKKCYNNIKTEQTQVFTYGGLGPSSVIEICGLYKKLYKVLPECGLPWTTKLKFFLLPWHKKGVLRGEWSRGLGLLVDL